MPIMKKNTTIPPILRSLALLALAALFLFSCAPRQTVPSADLLSTPNLLVEAAAAWERRNYEAAELYYAALLERPDLTPGALPTVYERLADSAIRSGHYHQARIALEDWANMDASVVRLRSWERLYLDTMAALNRGERLQNHLRWLLAATDVPWETRADAALWYGEYFRNRGDFDRSLETLAGFYVQAPSPADRAAMEAAYRATLQSLDNTRIMELSRAVTAEAQWRFPYVLVGFERGVREATDKAAWSGVWRTMRTLAARGELADRAPLEQTLAALEARFGLPRVGVAMALPLSGPFGKVGAGILRGAGLAQWRLAQDATDVDLRVINTDIPGWEARLAALPAHYSVVGGPLQVQNFRQLYEGTASGRRILDSRAVFAFLASLGDDLTEGRDAWRFFSSRDDEVRSLVSLSVDQLGIKDVAIFYPEEAFGRAMAETFYREAAPMGARVRGMQSYPPRELKEWSQRVARLLKVPANFKDNKDAPLPQPDFGAVFLPDGWGQAQTLLPNFFFYEGDQLLYLGTSLWSRALDSARNVDEHYYRLAVCPGAWWEGSDGGRALQAALTEEGLGQADFWVALGYDFVRFAGKIGSLPAGWTPADVNDRIASASRMDFSMAPISWNGQGVAMQEMYLFSPARNGKRLVNAASLADSIAKAKARRDRRLEAYEQRQEGGR
ncbi:penicillin-binding protein activator [Pseudodesulfovibrio pelocollis]|uniref:penicillin-binding protein activator n=1 Tax=Pseudodesulfovibrio pelocollis TaxID=3051432 RepID=UPI00255B0299|nr:penicillin-binding protein activator [Pseudodesulfovibrio sp. SB368]